MPASVIFPLLWTLKIYVEQEWSGCKEIIEKWYLCVSWQCLDLNKFEAAPTEGHLVTKALELLNNDTFWAGIVFENLQPNSSQLPPYVKYKIRMDIDDVERTRKVKERYVTQPSLLTQYKWGTLMKYYMCLLKNCNLLRDTKEMVN